MTDIDTDTLLFDARKRLVEAAERAINDPRPYKHPDKSQFNHLAALCNEASCQEEIENFLRYQSSRDRAPWDRDFAEFVIRQVAEVTSSIKDAMADADDRDVDSAKVKAWRLYAVYLMRAFTHHSAKPREQRRDRQEHRR